MKKKSYLLLIFFVAILFAMIIMPNKVMASEEITEVRFTGTEIKPGNALPSSVTVETVPANGLDTSVNVTWFKSNTGTDVYDNLSGLVATGNFESGKYYWVFASSLTPKSGYEWASSYKIYYNNVEIDNNVDGVLTDTSTEAPNWLKVPTLEHNIDLLGSESCVHVGELPTPYVGVHDNNFTIESVEWVYYDTGASTWKEFAGTPTAVDNGTKYGLKVTTKLDDGYVWDDSVTIRYNGGTISSSSKVGNIVYVDLGTVNDRQPVKFELNIANIGTDKTPDDIDGLMSLGTNNDFNTYEINGAGMFGITSGFVPTATTTVTELLSKRVTISKTANLENKIYIVGFGINFKIGYDPTMPNSILKINGTNVMLGESEYSYTYGLYYIVDLRIKHNVTFNANGHGTAPDSQEIAENEKVSKPTDLTVDGYTFGGWYIDENCTQAFDFETAIKNDVTLYAKWTANVSSSSAASSTPATAVKDVTPKTGTNSIICYVIGMMILSGVGIVFLKKKM